VKCELVLRSKALGMKGQCYWSCEGSRIFLTGIVILEEKMFLKWGKLITLYLLFVRLHEM
jgi:hypothetical protein